MIVRFRHLAVVLAALAFALAGGGAAAAAPTARAVLFYSPSCPHCHLVMDETLPPLYARYGDQLQIVTIDVTQPEGQALYQAAVAAFAIPEWRLGVPALIFDSTVLVGSDEIPSQLPTLIENALAAGGNNWPAIPGFVAPQAPPEATSPPASNPFARDPLGNGLAVVLLILMLGSVVTVALTARPPFDRPLPAWRERLIPILSLAGLAVAFYLSFIEISGTAAVCGPVGDCNAVQQSLYARLFGLIPIGLLGVAGYLVMLGAWALHRYAARPLAHQAALAMPLLALIGTLFSIYLTFLEPFVIGATCAWCLTSAALMTGLLWLTTPQRPAPPVRRGRVQRHAAH